MFRFCLNFAVALVTLAGIAHAQDRKTLPAPGLEVVYQYGQGTPTVRVAKILRVEGERYLIGSKTVRRPTDGSVPRYDSSSGYEYQYWVADEFRVEGVKEPAIDSGKTLSVTCSRSLPSAQMRDLTMRSTIRFINSCDYKQADGSTRTTKAEYVRTVLRKEKVSTPSGDFDTIVYRRERVFDPSSNASNGEQEKTTLWFAPALGVILREETEGMVGGRPIIIVNWAISVTR